MSSKIVTDAPCVGAIRGLKINPFPGKFDARDAGIQGIRSEQSRGFDRPRAPVYFNENCTSICAPSLMKRLPAAVRYHSPRDLGPPMTPVSTPLGTKSITFDN